MRLGVTSYAFTWQIGVPGYAFPEADESSAERMTALTLLVRAAELRVRSVQVLDNLPLQDIGLEELTMLRRRADELGLDLEIGTRGIEPQHLRDYLAVARALRSPLVRIVVDTATRKPTPDEVVQSLREVLADFEAASIDLAIENHDRFETGVLLSILEAVGSTRLGICLDTVNSFGALERPEVVVPALAPHAMSIHVKDFVVRRAPHALGLLIEGSPAGAGRLDIPWLLETVRVCGRDPDVQLELWTPPEASEAATIARERAWAEESIEYLRTLLPD